MKSWILAVVLVSSCGTIDKMGSKFVDAASKDDLNYKMFPLLEGLKTLDYRVDLLAQDLSKTNDHFILFNNNFKDFNRTLNNYIMENDKWKKEVELRLIDLENHHIGGKE